MDRNTIAGIVIIFILLIGYSLWITPSGEEQEALRKKQDSVRMVKRTADSIAAIRIAEQLIRDSIAKTQQQVITETADTAALLNQFRDQLGDFGSAALGEEKTYALDNGLITLSISTRGGKILTARINDFQTFDSLPLVLFDPEKTLFGLNFFMNNRLINTDQLFFEALDGYGNPVNETISLPSGQDSVSLVMRLYTDADTDSAHSANRYIEYRYTLFREQYMMNFSMHFEGLDDVFRQSSNNMELVWKAEMLKQEKAIDQFNGPTIYYKYYEDEVDYLSESKDDEESLVTRVKWISFKQRFFCATLIADNYFSNGNVKVFTAENQHDRYLKNMESKLNLAGYGGNSVSIPMKMYFGPNKFTILKKYDLDLERQIPIGWSFFLMAWINRFIVIPVFNFLESFGWNYGIIILVLTILLKIVLFPIAYRSYKSSAKMRVLKPEIDEIGAKYPKKDEAMKKQQAVMNLYKQAGVNPMAGCIPMLLQFPILIAMFRFFPSSFELRQKPFLWANDLSSYDSIFDLPFNIPFYGDHVSLFTLLMTVSTIIYTKMNNDLMGSSSQQLPGMKTMMYIMPIMFLGIFNNYASGLSYYYFLANIITFGQMYLIRQTIDEDKIRKQIEINKKKPKKKSGWQKRLEEAAKQRGYKPPKK
ncbi:MAG: membrane protein insertase YidC [Bacteroidales bacterium]|nr:membrane protein insertase YidC [Bacteroidales bacterium]